MDEFTKLAVIKDRAKELHEFLWANSGNTADYPIRIKVDDDEVSAKLANLLTRLKVALER